MSGIVLLGLLALAAPAAGPARPKPTAEPPRAEPPALVVEARGFGDDDVLEELRLRLDGRDVITMASVQGPERFSYCEIRRKEGAVAVSIILADGRAFDRVFEANADVTRIAAASVVNLIYSIESGAARPSRLDVEQPKPKQEAKPPPPEPPDDKPRPPKPRPVRPKPRPPPGPELGVGLHGGVTLGLAPTTAADVFAAGGGGLEFAYRAQNGAAAFLDLRASGQREQGLGLGRLRIGAGGGYVWRRGAVEIGAMALVTVEPWFLRRSGSFPDIEGGGATKRALPLLGGALRLSPGYLLRPRDRLALRIGPYFELAGSFVPDGGARTPVVEIDQGDGTSRAAFRLGGLEANLGVDLTLWFELPRPEL